MTGLDESSAQPPGDALQLDRAVFTERDGPSSCSRCHQPVPDAYYEVNGHLTCAGCRNVIAAAMTGGSPWRRFSLAALWGALAAVLGSGIYFAVAALTGYELGLVGIVVGILVGTAVRKGSDGRGGRGYQALAMFLTYASIVSTYIPPIIKAIATSKPAAVTADPAAGAPRPPAPPAEALPPASPQPASPSPANSVTAQPVKPTQVTIGAFLIAIGFLIGLAFVAPFLAGASNIMGILIIGFALYEAWKINRPTTVAITGPYRRPTSVPLASPAPPSDAAG